MSEEKILTLHPQNKKGVNILRRRYDVIRDFILKTVSANEPITFERVSDMATEQLSGSFDGKVMWYVVTVKLDLEARGIIERVPKSSPHQLKMKKRD